jgi:hypothetical protein
MLHQGCPFSGEVDPTTGGNDKNGMGERNILWISRWNAAGDVALR